MANQRLNAIITIGGVVSGSLSNAIGGTRRKLGQLGDTVRTLEKDQKALGKAIREAMQNGRPVGDLARQYRELEQRLKAARAEQDRMNRAVRGMDAGKSAIGRGMAIMGTATAALGTGLVPVVQAAAFEKAMLGVAKQVEGARDESGKLTAVYWDMVRAIQQLGREIPIPTNELAKMAEQGARMGVPKDQLVEFVRATAMMATALDLPREELADNMGKIANLFKLPIPAIKDLGDAINFLDDNSVAKGADLIDFLTRTGGIAGSVKVTANQMTALGSTLLSLGERTETAGTATNAFFQKLASADKGTKKFREALDELGLSTAAIQKGMQTDAQGTVLQVLEAIAKLPQEKRLGVLVDMVGLEHSDTIAKLVSGLGEYRKQIDLVNSQKVGGSMSREFAAQLGSTNAQWEITKNRVTELSVSIGTVLLPPLNELLGILGKGTSKLAEFAQEHPTLTKNVMVVGGAIAGSLVLWGAMTTLIGAAQVAFWGLTAAMLANPIGAIAVAFAAAAALIYANWEPIKEFFVNLWEDIKKLATALDDVLNKIPGLGKAYKATKWFYGFSDENPFDKPKPTSPRLPPPAPAAAWSAKGAAGPTDNSQTTINIQQQPGEDSRQLANRIADEQERQRRLRQRGALYDKPAGY